MEDFSKAPGGKDLSKMKAEYEMFVVKDNSKKVFYTNYRSIHAS